MKTEILIPCNDVFSPTFESKLDDYFTPKVKADWRGRYQRMDKGDMRTALTKPKSSKYWANGIIGVRSPVTKDG